MWGGVGVSSEREHLPAPWVKQQQQLGVVNPALVTMEEVKQERKSIMY